MSGNNYPLKGGKTDDFEGGTRVAAFISGGFVPRSLRGSVNHAYVHACDWYATLCGLAGIDPQDPHPAATGIPPIDSVDQWPTLLVRNATWEEGARQEMVLAYNTKGDAPTPSGVNAALIQGRFKIVTGHQGGSGFWTGPVHPNATGPPDPKRNGSACGAFSCCAGCLYDIQSDAAEHDDLRLLQPDTYARMHARLTDLAKSTYQTSYIQPNLKCLTPEQAKAYYRGFRGPPCFNATAFPSVPTPAPIHGFQLASPQHEQCLMVSNKLGLGACASTRALPAALWRVSDAKTGALASLVTSGSPLCIKMHEAPGWDCAHLGTNVTQAYIGHCSGAHKTNFFHTMPMIRRGDAGAAGAGPMFIQSHDCPRLCLARTSGSGTTASSARIGLAACDSNALGSQGWLIL
eukprot:g2924.t1